MTDVAGKAAVQMTASAVSNTVDSGKAEVQVTNVVGQ